MTARALTMGDRSYPLILPSVRDPRLHVAVVIITIHVLGQTALHFRVSVPQILAAILTSAAIEIAITFSRTRTFAWPASAMLTGSGVALILRVVGTAPDDHWTMFGWYVFAVVAGLSLLSKYVVRYGGSPLFNPSNVGLVLTFMILGSTRVEPLDFWWSPLTPWMAIAYVVILAGGLLITRRLHLLGLAVSFWVTLTACLGVLALSGHCMITNWAFAPVCGGDFWRVIVTSPEVLVFLFFMITDPRTVPAGNVGRITFGVLVGAASALLMASQTNEFGAKVGLLGGLVLVCAGRPLLDRLVLERGGWPVREARVALAAAAAVILAAGIVAAGTPARGLVLATSPLPDMQAYGMDPTTFPATSVEESVTTWDPEIAGPVVREILVTLSQNLEVEDQALLRRDASLLTSVDHGDRLIEMQDRVREAGATSTLVPHYTFDSIDMTLLRPFGRQDGLSLGLKARGTVATETYDATGRLQATTSAPFSLTFVVRRATGDRWLNVAVLPD